MTCIIQLYQRLMATSFNRHTAKAQIRAEILNRFTVAGMPTTTCVV